jgi:hypothetical protein
MKAYCASDHLQNMPRLFPGCRASARAARPADRQFLRRGVRPEPWPGAYLSADHPYFIFFSQERPSLYPSKQGARIQTISRANLLSRQADMAWKDQSFGGGGFTAPPGGGTSDSSVNSEPDAAKGTYASNAGGSYIQTSARYGNVYIDFFDLVVSFRMIA